MTDITICVINSEKPQACGYWREVPRCGQSNVRACGRPTGRTGRRLTPISGGGDGGDDGRAIIGYGLPTVLANGCAENIECHHNSCSCSKIIVDYSTALTYCTLWHIYI